MSKSPYEYFLHAVTALEKYRKRELWSENRIEINIPAFNLKSYQTNIKTNEHRVVVGTSYNKTPEIFDSIEYFVVYPYWYVPNSIVFNELIPKAKQFSTYFRIKAYDVLYINTVVKSDSIYVDLPFKYQFM